jgi:hypothetical protein
MEDFPMKKILVLLLILWAVTAKAQYIPNTDTFSLQDVVDGLCTAGSSIDACGQLGTPTSLSECFTLALYISNNIGDYFDASYSGSKDRLSNFRNYGGTACTRPTGLTTGTIYYTSYFYPTGFTSVWDAYDAKVGYCTDSLPIYSKSCQYDSLTVGEAMFDGTGTNCTKLADGWYFFDAYCTTYPENTLYYEIVSGVITQIFYGPS